MGKSKKIIYHLMLPLLIWSCIALILLSLPPVPKEPEGLPLETWSYYGKQAPPANQILKYRNEILTVIIMCAVLSEFLFFVLEKKKERIS